MNNAGYGEIAPFEQLSSERFKALVGTPARSAPRAIRIPISFVRRTLDFGRRGRDRGARARSVVHWAKVKNCVAPPNRCSNQKLHDVWLNED